MARYSKDSLDRFFDYDIHVESRTIYFGSLDSDLEGQESGVDSSLANRVIKGILLLQHISKEKIKIIMNTPGGDWYHGIAIYDAIMSCPCPVRIEVIGHAMSMGSIILQAADERILYPNSTIMIHDGHEGDKGGGLSPKSFQSWAKESKRNCKTMYQIYANRSKNKDVKYWERKCSNDYILSPRQAIIEGLADDILDPVKGLKKRTVKKKRRKNRVRI